MTPPASVELLELPPEYGSPSTTLDWDEVNRRIADAAHYWLATVRADGSPHVVPLDGLWIQEALYFGGSDQTAKHRILRNNPRAAVHLEDASHATIVEGSCEYIRADAGLAEDMSTRSKDKYGYGPPPRTYEDNGVWRLRPRRVIAWAEFPATATRFTFTD